MLKTRRYCDVCGVTVEETPEIEPPEVKVGLHGEPIIARLESRGFNAPVDYCKVCKLTIERGLEAIVRNIRTG